MKLVQVLLLSLLALGTTACGSGSNNSGSPSPTAHQNGACGSEVIADYNTVVIRCEHMRTEADARSCKSTGQSFLAKYPGINCKALKKDPNGVNSQEITVTATEVQKVVDQLTAAGF